MCCAQTVLPVDSCTPDCVLFGLSHRDCVVLCGRPVRISRRQSMDSLPFPGAGSFGPVSRILARRLGPAQELPRQMEGTSTAALERHGQPGVARSYEQGPNSTPDTPCTR